MKRYGLDWACAGILLAGATVVAAQVAPPSIKIEDCSQLKGKARAACQTRVAAATGTTQGSASSTDKNKSGSKATDDKFPFPEEQSRGTPAQRGSGTGDMPTSGVPDPPADSMRPLNPDGTPADAPPAPSSSSSSSSSSSADDDDAAPTTSGSDTPVKASSLKDLGSHGDISASRAKLEQNRVQDDLKVGHFYFQDGNYTGAAARYQDALSHDPENADAHYGLAEVLAKQGKRDEAVAHLQQYLNLAPDEDHSKDARKLLARLGKAK